MITIPSGPVRYGVPRLIGVALASAFGIGFGLGSGSMWWPPIFVACGVIGWIVLRSSVRRQGRRAPNDRLQSYAALLGVVLFTVAGAIGGPGADLFACADGGLLAGAFLSIWTSKYRDVEVSV